MQLRQMHLQLLLAMLRNPASTGALLPSSRTLANALACAVKDAELIIELGAGTGSVTDALVARLPDVPLIAVELQAPLARLLRHRHPAIDVRQSSAKEIVDNLIDHRGKIVLVSSLPFRSLPRQIATETAHSLCRFLARNQDRKLVQFTYQPREPFTAPQHFLWKRTAIVWRNTPPAGIWELKREP